MLSQPITAVPLAVVDVETTGLSAATGDRVCEVAVGRVEPGREIEVFATLVNPGRAIHPEASEVSGILDADVLDAPPFAQVIPVLDDLVAGALLVAHNAPFDVAFLAAEYAIARAEPPAVVVLDTLALARRNFHFPSNGLGSLATSLGVPVDLQHRAAGDVVTTWRVLRRMVDVLARRGCVTVADFLSAQGPVVAFDMPRARALPYPLGQAIDAGRPVTICYIDANGRSTERIVDPLWANDVYLIAWCRQQRAQRTFRLDRIVDAWLA